MFKLAQREPVKSPRTFLATVAACSCAIISHGAVVAKSTLLLAVSVAPSINTPA